jgi:soluble lytic murein transglycosylase
MNRDARMNLRPGALCAFLTLAACAEHRVAGPPPSESTARVTPFFEGASSAAALARGAGGDAADALVGGALPGPFGAAGKASDAAWIEAVRLERWADAASLLDALSEAGRARPVVRYVRARAAIGAGDAARAVPLLDGLEQALPVLAGDIARARAEAQLEAGPYPEAAAYFVKSSTPRDLIRATRAYEKAGDAGGARRAADMAVAAAARDKSLRIEAEARMARARILKAKGGDALAEPDLRWVAVRAPSTPEGREAAAALDAMKRPLSPKERLAAVDALVESGSAEAVGELERVGKATAAPKEGLAHARAMALYKARSYGPAAKAFREAARAPGKPGHDAEDLFYAARSLSRDGQEPEAIKAYLDVAARFKKSPYAERAQYLAARLYLQIGKNREAEVAYGAYLANYKKGEQRDEATYERALAQLSGGSAAAARKTLGELARKARRDEGGKLRELEGVAALRDGDRDGAVALWEQVAREEPLSWAAQAARARLITLGAPAPALIEPSPSRPAIPLGLKLPDAAALLASVGLDGDAERHLAAVEREAAAPYGGRSGEALCGLYGLLSRGKRRYRVGVRAVSAEALRRAPSEDGRWAWECLYPEPFAGGVRELEDRYTLPRGLLHALMRQESAFDPVVISPANAVGLMQLIPSTARQVAAELSTSFEPAHLTVPDVNLRLGAFYVTKLLKMWKGSVALAAASYNAGPRAVSRWVEAGAEREVDVWVARIPYDETRTYVARVAGNLARYQWLAGGEAAVTPLPLELPEDTRAPSDAY